MVVHNAFDVSLVKVSTPAFVLKSYGKAVSTAKSSVNFLDNYATRTNRTDCQSCIRLAMQSLSLCVWRSQQIVPPIERMHWKQ